MCVHVYACVCPPVPLVPPFKATVATYKSHLQTVLSLNRKEGEREKKERFSGMYNDEREEGNQMETGQSGRTK